MTNSTQNICQQMIRFDSDALTLNPAVKTSALHLNSVDITENQLCGRRVYDIIAGRQ